jgi:hydroxycarboxylate dehydrogenase B
MPRMADKYISTAALQRWVDQLWRAAGCSADEARLTAEHLVGANLAGHDSHGVGMVPRYVSSWLADELQLNQHVAVTSDSGAMLSLDAHRGMGQSMAYEAMKLAIERAQQHGVCVIGLKNAHHIGRIGHWAEQAVAAGLVSVHFVNAMSKPVVAPFRGTEARYVTNPFTVGIPVPGREPMLLDFATSAIAMGKVRVAYNSGKKVPEHMLMDTQGEYTDDPAALFPPAGQPGGALVPFAQHKGYALAMVVEVLAAALTGGETTRPGNLRYQHAVWNNMLAMVFDPARLSDQQLFGAEVNAFVDWVQSARLREGAEPILMPGDPERASRRARAQHMPVDEGTLAELDQAAAQVNQARGTQLPALSSLAG